VVVRSSLIPFACITRNHVSVLSAEPSIKCTTTDPTYRRMRAVGGLTLVVYGVGLPMMFAWLLHTHGPAVIADQELRARDEGETPLTNPNIHIRRRLRKLYEDYKPEHRCVCPCRLSPPPVVGQQSGSRVPGCGRGISSAPWLL
jgi:hypothetical protein